MAGVAKAAEEAKLVPKIAGSVSLAETIPALTALESHGVPKGKFVIVPRPETTALLDSVNIVDDAALATEAGIKLWQSD